MSLSGPLAVSISIRNRSSSKQKPQSSTSLSAHYLASATQSLSVASHS
jgi:hypothetical protein